MGNRLISFFRTVWQEYRFVILFFAFVVIPVRSSLADWNWVPTGSMKPTILEGDLVFVNKAAYDLRVPLTKQRIWSHSNPERGDIVVCFSPVDETRLIKRVVAVPGDVIETRNYRLLINGEEARYQPSGETISQQVEPVLQRFGDFHRETLNDSERHVVFSRAWSRDAGNFGPFVVPEDQYFLLGDNRDNSLDSREFGAVDRSQIVGRGRKVLVSFNKLDSLRPRWNRWGKSLR